jgi:hypothetical protein
MTKPAQSCCGAKHTEIAADTGADAGPMVGTGTGDGNDAATGTLATASASNNGSIRCAAPKAAEITGPAIENNG